MYVLKVFFVYGDISVHRTQVYFMDIFNVSRLGTEALWVLHFFGMFDVGLC